MGASAAASPAPSVDATGLTTQEADAHGLPNRSITDVALRFPDYAFYPASCLQDAPARG